MLRVAVCDDEKIIANQMEKCVLDICRKYTGGYRCVL